MRPTSIEQLIKAANGIALTGGSGSVTDVTTDSRAVVPGSLFVCIRGEKVDGHDYLGMALEKGAVAAFCEKLPAADVVRAWFEAGRTLI
ncbi:MAG: hypothetical protein IKX91_02550, partial [Firmicutes bacterium]|nr:hypothetical protein [Bacillota bacterium]